MKILHVITTLEQGGAQSILADLVERWEEPRDSHLVVSLRSVEDLPVYFKAKEFLVKSLDMEPGEFSFAKLQDLIQIVRSYQPDLIQTWLYHADLMGSLAAWLGGKIPVVWGIHHTTTGKDSVKPSTWRIVGLLKIIARFSPAKIVCCSHSSSRTHRDLGFPDHKIITVLNGIDTDKFSPNPGARQALRRELGLAEHEKLVGLFARYNPQKDHKVFLQAAAILLKRLPETQFLLAGQDIEPGNDKLQGEIEKLGIGDNLHLLGRRDDMDVLNAAIDLATLSSSYGEALPLSLAEALACGTPAVGTNVGDIAELIGSGGKVVEPGNPEALAEAWASILELSDQQYHKLSGLARKRIVERYNLTGMIGQYRGVYCEVLS